MSELKIFNESEKKEIEQKLNEQFGIKKIPGSIIKTGTERLFLFQGNLSREQILKLSKEVLIERIGVYFAKQEENQNNKLRLSIEGTQILKSQIDKNTFELDENETQNWMKGRDLNISTGKNDFVIITHNGEFMGTGKASALKISNFIPKNRRLRDKD